MSYAWLLGIVTGIVIVGIVTALRRRTQPEESDERTQMIRREGESLAFRLLGALVMCVWLGDNLLAYIQGAPPRIASPWSALVVAMLVLSFGSRLYYKWRVSVLGDWNAGERRDLQRRATMLLGGAVALGESARMAFGHDQATVGWVLVAGLCLEVLAGIFLLAQVRKRAVGSAAK